MILLLLACRQPPEQTLTVVAASSLTEVFTALETELEAQHPELDLRLSFAGSQVLVTWLQHGLEADAVALADPSYFDPLVQEGLVQQPHVFATNRLVVASTRGLDLRGLVDAERLVLGAPEVPIGAYTDRLLDRAELEYGEPWRREVESRVVSREPNVRQVAAKLSLGEADAAIVYATDVDRAVELPSELAPVPELHHAALTEAGRQWTEWVEGPEGRRLLEEHGFRTPP